MFRIALLADREPQETFFVEQISQFCAKRGLFPQIEPFRDQEQFFKAARKAAPTNTVIALSGVAGLNAAEHLRALWPECRIIWCSDLDFSLHALRLRVDYFLLEPVSVETFQLGLTIWFEKNMPRIHP